MPGKLIDLGYPLSSLAPDFYSIEVANNQLKIMFWIHC